jgi:putative flippase GtrA
MANASALPKRIRRFALVGAAATTVHALIAFVAIRFSRRWSSATRWLVVATAFSYAAQTLWTSAPVEPRTMGKFGRGRRRFLCTIAVSGAVDRMGIPTGQASLRWSSLCPP